MFKVLIPPKSLLGKLRKEVDNPNQVLDQVRTSLKHTFDNTLATHKPGCRFIGQVSRELDQVSGEGEAEGGGREGEGER